MTETAARLIAEPIKDITVGDVNLPAAQRPISLTASDSRRCKQSSQSSQLSVAVPLALLQEVFYSLL
jgi:hypothetical protein